MQHGTGQPGGNTSHWSSHLQTGTKDLAKPFTALALLGLRDRPGSVSPDSEHVRHGSRVRNLLKTEASTMQQLKFCRRTARVGKRSEESRQVPETSGLRVFPCMKSIHKTGEGDFIYIYILKIHSNDGM